jgi:hypothetical protein
MVRVTDKRSSASQTTKDYINFDQSKESFIFVYTDDSSLQIWLHLKKPIISILSQKCIDYSLPTEPCSLATQYIEGYWLLPLMITRLTGSCAHQIIGADC